MKGGDSTVNLGVVFPRGAVDPSSRPSLAPRLGEKYHRRWVIEGSSNTSRILSRLVRILYRFCIDFEFESTRSPLLLAIVIFVFLPSLTIDSLFER